MLNFGFDRTLAYRSLIGGKPISWVWRFVWWQNYSWGKGS